MTLRPQLLGIAMLSAAWTLAAGAAGDAHEPILIDPSGDAYEHSARDMSTVPQGACAYVLGLPDQACDPLAPPSEDMPEGGTPAPAGLDIVAVHMRETPQDLVVELHVATLDAGFSQAMPREGAGAHWIVCWGTAECVGATTFRADGRVAMYSFITQGEAACGDSGACFLHVPIAFEPGAPGRVVWSVPRALLVDGDAGATLSSIEAGTSSTNAQEGVDWAATTPLRSPAGGGGSLYWTTDRASGGRAFTFQTASSSSFDALARSEGADEPGDAPFPDADIRRIAYLENDTTFTLAVEMGRVGRDAPAFTIIGGLGFRSGPSFFLTVDNARGESEMRLQRCGDANCSYYLPAPGRTEIVVGSPGWINLTLDRHDLDHPPRGTRLNGVYLGTYVTDTTSAQPVPAASAGVLTWRLADWLVIGPPYALRYDSAITAEDQLGHEPVGVIIRDPARDAVASSADIDASSGMYDLVLAGVEGTSTTSSRVTIGVRDLARMSVPAGAKAVSYSVAIETDVGATIVGFYREASGGVFFCASDTLVLAEEKQDPAEAAWTELEGVLFVAGDGAGAIGSDTAAPSMLTIFVPHSCFGSETPGEIPAHSLTAAIHVIPQAPVLGFPLRAIETVDEARDENVTAFALGTAVAQPRVAAWYAEPFGIAGFWDIMGIALAIVLPIGGILAVRGRRNALRRYLEEIERALAAHAAGSKARELALVGIRRRVRDDLVAGRISEPHYQQVDTRVSEHLKQERLRELTEAFDDLPHRLMEKLLQILGDGTITRDEARRFGALLEGSGLTSEAKERIRRKLELWVVEDVRAPA